MKPHVNFATEPDRFTEQSRFAQKLKLVTRITRAGHELFKDFRVKRVANFKEFALLPEFLCKVPCRTFARKERARVSNYLNKNRGNHYKVLTLVSI